MIDIKTLNEQDFQNALNHVIIENDTKFINTITNEKDDIIGIKYIHLNKSDIEPRYLSIGDPDLISWLYEKDVNIKESLQKLRAEYYQIDELNSILFEYVMEINRIIKMRGENIINLIDKYQNDETLSFIFKEILNQQKELIKKL